MKSLQFSNEREAIIAGNLREVAADMGFQVIKADVPLAEMFGYITTLRSITSGRATFNMEFSHYAQVPDALADIVIKKAKGIYFVF